MSPNFVSATSSKDLTLSWHRYLSYKHQSTDLLGSDFLVFLLLTLNIFHIIFSIVSIVDFEQVNVSWVLVWYCVSCHLWRWRQLLLLCNFDWIDIIFWRLLSYLFNGVFAQCLVILPWSISELNILKQKDLP